MSAITRSIRAKHAKHVFYRDFNDVDIFVEDTAAESKKIYVNLLSRVLAGLSFTQVFPLGDKDEVYRRCAADQGVRARPAVYIVDGDHDELIGKDIPKLNRLYRLKRYCIENYLFDESAATAYLDDELPSRSYQSIGETLAFAPWREALAGGLMEHLCAVIVAHRKGCGGGLKRSNVRLGDICQADEDVVDEALIAALVNSCSARVDGVCGEGAFLTEHRALQELIRCEETTAMLRFVSGKAVLLPLLRRRMRRVFGVARDEALFRVRLAKYCDVSELTDLSRALN